MAYERQSPEELRKLAEQVIKAIMENEELVNQLGDSLLEAGAKKCPKNHKCERNKFTCPRPFSCPKMHSIVWVPI